MLHDTSALFSQSGTATAKLVERAVLLATPAVVPADAVGETADMAGLAARSTASESSLAAEILRTDNASRH